MLCVRSILLPLIAGICLALSAQTAAWAADAAKASAIGSLEGAWRAVSMVHGGRTLPEDQVRRLMFVFSDKTIAMRVGPKLVAQTAYKTDAEAKPATIDMTFEGQATQGIYELDGDKLRICLNDLGKGRPKEIPASAGSGCDADLQLVRADRQWAKLYLIDADGSHARRLVTDPEYTEQGSAEWSLDGEKIGFDAHRPLLGESWSAAHVFVCRADGKELKDLGPGAMPSWSPDGKRVTFSCYSPRGVWIMNADGSARELVDASGWGAEWWPKGNQIAYTTYGSDPFAAAAANIAVRDLDKKTSRGLLEPRYRQIYWGMAWSPDSQWIAFKGVTSDNKAEVAVVHAEGQAKGFRVLVSEGAQGVKHLMDNVSWSPDSKQVLCAFSTPSNPALQLYVVDIQGKSPPEALPRQPEQQSCYSVAWSPDGKQILVAIREKP
jgi:TolB protein